MDMRNLTLLTDFYELTMMYGFMKTGLDKKQAIFDIFYRPTPHMNYAVACGLEQAIDYIENIKFTSEDIEYLRGLNTFGEDFFDRIRDFKFTGDIYAVPEGTIVFPYEPIMTIKAPLFEAQLLETTLLNILNHQTLIASKASRIVYAARGKGVMEFGLRRAQGPDAGYYGARAAMISGCVGTSNVLTGKELGVPVSGTHAHSWIMSFGDELTAFRNYAAIYPNSCVLLVDTYDTLKSGVPNAIKVFDELRLAGFEPVGIRLDSGDLAYLSKKARKMLDDAGYPNAKIIASGDIDEFVINSLNVQGAMIDTYGIGTKLITSHNNPSLGGVYKLAAIEEDGRMVNRIKVSDTLEKVTNPGFKTVYRIYKDGKAAADLIALKDEVYDVTKPLTITHPLETWKKTTFVDYEMRELSVPIYLGGRLVYDRPSINEIIAYAKRSMDELWEEYKRISNPHEYKVDLSDTLREEKRKLLSSSQDL
ncbi:MAG: nicotinate phosphoribosyltransferase [Clostridia bacterium]|nr:nicotinate phosphoribosyltransferase [Clostridia bacterium]